MSRTDDIRIRRTRPLIAPAILQEEIPITAVAEESIATSRRAVADIIHGRDERMLVVVGPCSVHDPHAVMEYAGRLADLRPRVADQALLVMRVYFEKPRTTIGWKGYINDPGLDESFNVNAGLRGARRLLRDIAELDIPAGTEFLDTTFGQYYADFISWGAIGARTVESQVHRQLASGLSMPVGIKNATNGDITVAIDALIAAAAPHLFPSLTREGAPALLETTGNEDGHLILRGGARPNFDTCAATLAQLDERGIRTGVMVDCSHGNSQKQHVRQLDVARSVVSQRRDAPRICGLMLESHLHPGRQDAPRTYGQSITDACLGWEETSALLLELFA